MQDRVLRLTLDASQRYLSFVIAYNLNFIAIGYKKDLCKFEKLPLYNKFHKANGRFFFIYVLLQSEGKRENMN